MASSPSRPSRAGGARARDADDGALRYGMLALALVQLGLGTWMAVAPRGFVDAVGGYGGAAPHFIRDMASWELALALAAALAVNRPRWRLPVLVFAVAHWTLHTINHIIDVDGTDPGWLGPGAIVSLGLGAALLALLLQRERQRAD